MQRERRVLLIATVFRTSVIEDVMKDLADLTNATILIIDDEADNLIVAQRVLKHYGAMVHSAEDGERGLALLSTLTPNLILLDISMPRINGFVVLEAIRENPALNKTLVIAMTALAMPGDRESILQAGFDFYIAKPFRLETFLTEIRAALEEIDKRKPLQ